MHQQIKGVIVMDSDPQVLKGLVLLLEDMQFNAISLDHRDGLDNINTDQTDCPALLLLPFEINNGNAGIELVTRLRALFKHRIPAILLSNENDLSTERFVAQDVVVLSNQIKPKYLRRNIITILSNEPTKQHA